MYTILDTILGYHFRRCMQRQAVAEACTRNKMGMKGVDEVQPAQVGQRIPWIFNGGACKATLHWNLQEDMRTQAAAITSCLRM